MGCSKIPLTPLKSNYRLVMTGQDGKGGIQAQLRHCPDQGTWETAGIQYLEEYTGGQVAAAD